MSLLVISPASTSNDDVGAELPFCKCANAKSEVARLQKNFDVLDSSIKCVLRGSKQPYELSYVEAYTAAYNLISNRHIECAFALLRSNIEIFLKNTVSVGGDVQDLTPKQFAESYIKSMRNFKIMAPSLSAIFQYADRILYAYKESIKYTKTSDFLYGVFDEFFNAHSLENALLNLINSGRDDCSEHWELINDGCILMTEMDTDTQFISTTRYADFEESVISLKRNFYSGSVQMLEMGDMSNEDILKQINEWAETEVPNAAKYLSNLERHVENPLQKMFNVLRKQVSPANDEE